MVNLPRNLMVNDTEFSSKPLSMLLSGIFSHYSFLIQFDKVASVIR